MTTLCKRIIESADKYNVVLNTNNHTTTSSSNSNTTDHHNDMLQDVNFCRLLGCINQLKLLSLSIVETFDNLTCLVVDINDRALAANRRIESIASTLADVDYKVKTTSIYNNANQVAKDTYNKTNRNPYNISLLIRNTNCKQIAQVHYNCTGLLITSYLCYSINANTNTNTNTLAPPKLWLLDNIIGENSDCVSNYSDINFFFSSWFESELKQQGDNKEKKRQEKKKARLLLTHQEGDDDDVENDEIEYWGEHDDIDESIASTVNDDDDNIDDRISTKSLDKNKTKFLKGATKVLKIFKRNSTSGGVKEDKGDANSDENATVVSKDSPDEKPSSLRKNSYLNAYDNIASSNIRDSITSKKLDSKEEEEIKEKIRDIKKYVDLDPQELPTFIVPNTKPNKKKTKKTKKKSKDKLNGKMAKMTIAETPAQRKGSIKIEDLVRRQSGRLTPSLPSDSPPFSPPSFISDGSSPSPIVPLRSFVSPIKGLPERAPSIAESVARQSISKIFAASSPPPPPPPPPPGPSKLAISSLLSDIKKNQTLRRVSIKEKVDSRALLLNSIRQRSKDVQERNTDSNKFDNLKSQTSNIKPTQNEAISAILANRKLIAGSDSESDSDSDFSDD